MREQVEVALTIDPDTAVTGQDVQLVAQVTAPFSEPGSGTVRFSADNTLLGEALLSELGEAQLTATFDPGTFEVVASFDDDDLYAGGQDQATLTVEPADTTLVLDVDPDTTVDAGQALTFSATLAVLPPGAGVPTGEIELLVGGEAQQTLPVSPDGDPVVFEPESLPPGVHPVEVRYAGDGRFEASASDVVEVTVRTNSQVTLASSPATSVVGQDVEVSVTVTSDLAATPTGQTALRLGGEDLAVLDLDADGTARTTVRIDQAGETSITATYLGDERHTPSAEASLTQVVTPASTSVEVSVDPQQVDQGDGVTVSAQVTVDAPGGGQPQGEAVLYDGEEVIGSAALVDGEVVFDEVVLDPGVRSLTVGYEGSADHLASVSEPVEVTVRWSTQVVLEPPAATVVGQAASVEVSVDTVDESGPTPAGAVAIEIDGDEVARGTLQDGVVTLDVPSGAAGQRVLQVAYLGDDTHVGSATSVTHEVAPAATTVTLAGPEQAVENTQVTFTAEVAVVAPGGGQPAGSVELHDADGVLATQVLTGGTVAFDVSFAEPGDRTLEARYLGSDDHEAATSDPLVVAVTQVGALEFSVRQDGRYFSPSGQHSFTSFQPWFCASRAVQVTALVEDEDGQVVRTLEQDVRYDANSDDCPQQPAFWETQGLGTPWDGKDDEGQQVADGAYRIVISGTDDDGVTVSGEVATGVEDRPAGTLLQPAANDTLAGLVRFVFDPAEPFEQRIIDVRLCLASAGCSTIYGPSEDGLWRTSRSVGTLNDGPTTLSTRVRWTDPLGTTHSWDPPSIPVEIDTTAIPIHLQVEPVVGDPPLVTTVTFEAASPVQRPLLYTVEFGDGSPNVQGTIASPYDPVVVEHTYASSGTFRLQVRVDDGQGGAAEASQDVEVSGSDNQPPTALLVADPRSGIAPLSVTFDVDGTDPDGDDLTFVFDPGDGSAPVLGSLPTAAIQHTYATAGTFLASLTLSDGWATNTATRSVDVLPESPVAATLEADRAGGMAPLAVLFDLTVEGGRDSVSWEFDPGDGSSPSSGTDRTASRPHSYQEPGVYRARLRASDGRDSDVASFLVEVVQAELMPVARAGDDRIVVAGEQLRLEGSSSQPTAQVASYTWDLGDGRSATGESVLTSWAEPGEFLVTLTVEVDGRSATDTLTVEVQAPQPDAMLVRVVSQPDSVPLPGAQVVVIEPDGAMRNATTNEQGDARLEGLDDGEVWVAAYFEGYRPAGVDAVVVDGSGEVEVSLEAGPVGVGDVEVTRLTPEEAEQLGVIMDDPDNEFVWEAEIRLNVEPFPFSFAVWSTPERTELLPGPGGPGGPGGPPSDDPSGPRPVVCTETRCTVTSGGYQHTYSVGPVVRGVPPTLTYMVIPVEGRFLKEFFHVEFGVINLAPARFPLVDVTAQLDLPEGLSLAPTRDGQQRTIELGEIGGGQAASADWVIRGDEEGFYHLEATARGDLEPFGAPVRIDARTAEAFRVWGASALRFLIEVDEVVHRRAPYGMRLGLQNVADVDVHGAQFTYLENTSNVIYQPRQQRTLRLGTIPAGETVWTDDAILVPAVSGAIYLPRSEVVQIAGVVPESRITTRPPLRPVNGLPRVQVSDRSDYHVVAWDPVEGAEGYELYVTPDLATQFPSTSPPGIWTERIADHVAAVPRVSQQTEIAVTTIIDGERSLEHPVVQGRDGQMQPATSIAFLEGRARMCGEPVTLQGQFVDPLLNLASYELEIGADEVRSGPLSGSSGQSETLSFDPEEVAEDGLVVRMRAIDELGNVGSWSQVRLYPDCPGRPVAVIAGGLGSSLSVGDDYLADLFGRPDDPAWASVVGQLTSMGYDLGHGGQGDYQATNRTILEFSYRGADVSSGIDGPRFVPRDYGRLDWAAALLELAHTGLADSNPLLVVAGRRAFARAYVAPLIDYDRAWHAEHGEWLEYHLIGHSLGARQMIHLAGEIRAQAQACHARSGSSEGELYPGYPCARLDELVGSVVSVSGAVYPGAVARDIRVASCRGNSDDPEGDLRWNLRNFVVSGVGRVLGDAADVAQRGWYNDEMSAVGSGGAPVDTIAAYQDHCLSTSATMADPGLPNVTSAGFNVASDGMTAHSALLKGSLPNGAGDFAPLRRVIDQHDRFPRPETPGPRARAASLDEVSVAMTEGGAITGRVVSPQGVALDRAEVIAVGADEQLVMSMSDADGTFEISGLAAGSYRLFANPLRPGQAGAWVGGQTPEQASVFELQDGQSIDVGDVGGIATHTVTVEVVDAQGRPAPMSVVELRVGEGSGVVAAVDGDGLARVGEVLPGDYELVVAGLGWATTQQSITVDGDLQVAVTLEPAPYTLVEILDEDGRPVPLLLVEILDDQGEVIGADLTDLTGWVAITDLPVGTLQARVSDPGQLFTMTSTTFEVTAAIGPAPEVFTSHTVDAQLIVGPPDDDGSGGTGPGDGSPPTDPGGPGAPGGPGDPGGPGAPGGPGDPGGQPPSDPPPDTDEGAAPGPGGAGDADDVGVADGNVPSPEDAPTGSEPPTSEPDDPSAETDVAGELADLLAVLEAFSDVSPDDTHAVGIATLVLMEVIMGFDDGTFRPGLQVTRAQLASMLARALELEEGGVLFPDVPVESVHAAAISAAAEAGIVQGFADGTFGPGLQVTRAQLASMLARALELEEGGVLYPDVPVESVHAAAISAAAEAGIVQGFADGTFGPGIAVTRAQTATMLARALFPDGPTGPHQRTGTQPGQQPAGAGHNAPHRAAAILPEPRR